MHCRYIWAANFLDQVRAQAAEPEVWDTVCRLSIRQGLTGLDPDPGTTPVQLRSRIQESGCTRPVGLVRGVLFYFSRAQGPVVRVCTRTVTRVRERSAAARAVGVPPGQQQRHSVGSVMDDESSRSGAGGLQLSAFGSRAAGLGGRALLS